MESKVKGTGGGRIKSEHLGVKSRWQAKSQLQGQALVLNHLLQAFMCLLVGR